MADNNIDRIMENMTQFMTVLHKKLLRMDRDSIGIKGNLTRLHFAIMGILGEGSLPVSELARTLMVTKPQMTHLVDQLVKLNIVDRQPDIRDRRVINLVLTENGLKLRDEMQQIVRETIRQKLAGLSRKDIASIADAMETLRTIGAKLN